MDINTLKDLNLAELTLDELIDARDTLIKARQQYRSDISAVLSKLRTLEREVIDLKDKVQKGRFVMADIGDTLKMVEQKYWDRKRGD